MLVAVEVPDQLDRVGVRDDPLLLRTAPPGEVDVRPLELVTDQNRLVAAECLISRVASIRTEPVDRARSCVVESSQLAPGWRRRRSRGSQRRARSCRLWLWRWALGAHRRTAPLKSSTHDRRGLSRREVVVWSGRWCFVWTGCSRRSRQHPRSNRGPDQGAPMHRHDSSESPPPISVVPV